jgi:hypothetical protein
VNFRVRRRKTNGSLETLGYCKLNSCEFPARVWGDFRGKEIFKPARVCAGLGVN